MTLPRRKEKEMEPMVHVVTCGYQNADLSFFMPRISSSRYFDGNDYVRTDVMMS